MTPAVLLSLTQRRFPVHYDQAYTDESRPQDTATTGREEIMLVLTIILTIA